MVPVKGKVTVDDQPLAQGTVTFYPTDQANKDNFTGCPMGTIKPDGTYELSVMGKSGAPTGAYKVVISSAVPPTGSAKVDPAAATAIDPAVTSPDRTTLTTTVVETPGAGAYDFKVKGK